MGQQHCWRQHWNNCQYECGLYRQPKRHVERVLTIRPPPVDELARRWPEIEPLLRRATDRTDGCYEPVDVLQLALSAQLWVWLIEDAGELAGIATARLNVFPRKRLLTVDFIAGRRLAEWWPLLVAE